MQHVINIRKSTGMGQESMAAFLGLTRQALDKVEKGLCSLSTSNLIKLTRLQACLETMPVANSMKHLDLAEYEQFQKREAECRYLIAVLEKRLARQDATIQKCMLLYESICMLQPTDEGDELWIQKTKKEITNKLSNCGTAVCMRLRKRIYLLTAEADYIRRFVDENNIHQ